MDRFMGLDIGGTKTLLLVCSEAGDVLHEESWRSTGDLEELYSHIRERADGVKAIGCAVAGSVRDGRVMRARALGWEDLPLAELLSEEFGVPVYAANDASMAAVGERWLGAGNSADDMVMITLGTGIGGAVISNGRIVSGFRGRAGEIGYMLGADDVMNGNLNVKGMQGVFERKCSGTALGSHGMSSIEVFRAYERREPEAVAIIDRFVSDLAVSIANIMCVTDPEKFIIGGGVSGSMHLVIGKLRKRVAELIPLPGEIVLASLGNRAGALGAVKHAIELCDRQ